MIALILTSYLGVFAYIIFQGRGMAERNRAKEAHDDLRRIAGFSVADEIDKLDKLRKSDQSRVRNSRGFPQSWFNSQGGIRSHIFRDSRRMDLFAKILQLIEEQSFSQMGARKKARICS